MINSILIDDEAAPRNSLRHLIHQHCPDLRIVGEADSMKAGVAAIRTLRPDLVFLDVEMPDGTGFDLLDSFPDVPFGLIFVTAHEKYAIRAFRFSALDFLLKPVLADDLRSTYHRFRTIPFSDFQQKLSVLRENRPSITRISLPAQEGYRFIPIADIVHCEADGNYTWFHLQNREKILVSSTLKEYDDLLTAHRFFRIHHGYLVNLNRIARYVRGEGGTVILENGRSLEVSRRRKEAFLLAMRTLCV